jgi:hypothetical protein
MMQLHVQIVLYGLFLCGGLLLTLCYSWLQVRAELPAPQPGQLPLPRSLSPQLQQQLTGELPGWQQLPWPAGQVAQQPQPNPKAALQFKVGEGLLMLCTLTIVM